MARLRLLGSLTPAGRERAGLRWFNGLSSASAAQVLVGAGLDREAALAMADRRPVASDGLPPHARSAVTGSSA